MWRRWSSPKRTPPAGVLLPLLVLLPALAALWSGGLPNTADGTVHFVRATEMVHAWEAGLLLPRWSLNLGFGLGIPLFVYAPPLPYLLVAALHGLGLSPEVAYKAMLTTALVIGASGAFRLGRLHGDVRGGVWGGVLASAAFVYAPIQLRELFVQGNAGQFVGWSFLPWALWAVLRLYQTPRWPYALLLALALCGALLSHNVVALLLLETVALFGLGLWLFTRRSRAFWLTVAGGAWGVALSAWFSLPALLESSNVALQVIAASDYRDRFVALAELVAWPLRLDTGAINPYIPLTLGLPHLLVAGVGVLAWMGRSMQRPHPSPPPTGEGTEESQGVDPSGQAGRREGDAAPHPSPPTMGEGTEDLPGAGWLMLVYTLGCAWLATASSAPLWAVLPFAELFEFPARWHGFTTLGLAWWAAAAVGALPRRAQPWLGSAGVLLLVGSALVSLYPHKLDPGMRRMSPYEVVRYEVRSGAVGTTSLGEFTPSAVTVPLTTSPLVEAYLARQPVDRLAGQLPPGAAHTVVAVTPHMQQYRVTLPQPATVNFLLHAFPGWTAHVNGLPVAVQTAAGTGLLTLDLPAGEADVLLRFGPTPLRRAVEWVSAAAWLAWVAVGVMLVARARAAPHTFPWRQAGLLLLLMLALEITRQTGAGWLQVHSPPDRALPAQQPLRVDFGDQFRLLGVDPPPPTVRAGDALTLVAYWRALDKMDENYTVRLTLDEITTGATVLALEQQHPSDIPTSGWATGLYLRNALRLAIPATLDPIQYRVQLQLFDPAANLTLPTLQGDRWEVGRVWVLAAPPPRPPEGPTARFGEAVTLLGAAPTADGVTLYWRADAPVQTATQIFVHLLDAQGQVIGQLDGAPYANRYPLVAWRVGQVIEDARTWAATDADPTQVAAIALGLYDLASGARLPALDAAGARLPNDAWVIPLR